VCNLITHSKLKDVHKGTVETIRTEERERESNSRRKKFA